MISVQEEKGKKMNDFVHRSEILFGLNVFSDDENGNEHFLNGIETAKEIVEDAIGVDAVPVVHGHWIPIMIPTGVSAFGVNEMTCESEKCSVCNAMFWVGEERRYCPSCGAKMDEERKDDDK